MPRNNQVEQEFYGHEIYIGRILFEVEDKRSSICSRARRLCDKYGVIAETYEEMVWGFRELGCRTDIVELRGIRVA